MTTGYDLRKGAQILAERRAEQERCQAVADAMKAEFGFAPWVFALSIVLWTLILGISFLLATWIGLV